MKVKNVKKILATVITATLAIGVAGCASSTPEKTYATEKVKDAYQDLFDNAFKGISVDINDLITFDKGSAPKFYNKIAETLKSPEAKQLVAGKKAQSEIEYSISINSASVALAKRKIEGMFQGYELELDIEGAGQFGSLFAGLFEYDPVSLEQLEADE